MSDYTEHLISMAGGDGDPLDAIEARAELAEVIGPVLSKNPEHNRIDEFEAVLSEVIDAVLSLPRPLNQANRTSTGIFLTDMERRLVNLIEEQAATIARVLTLANTRGRCGWSISSDELRKVLRGES